MVNFDAKMALMRGDAAKAREILEKALLDNLEDAGLFFDLADAFLDLGEWEKAKNAAEYGIKLDNSSALGYRFKGFALLQLGDPAAAFGELYVALELLPNHPETLRLIAGCFIAMNGARSGLKTFEKLINDFPGYIPAYVDYVNALLSLEEFKKAEEIAEELLEMYPGNTDVLDLNHKVNAQKLASDLLGDS